MKKSRNFYVLLLTSSLVGMFLSRVLDYFTEVKYFEMTICYIAVVVIIIVTIVINFSDRIDRIKRRIKVGGVMLLLPFFFIGMGLSCSEPFSAGGVTFIIVGVTVILMIFIFMFVEGFHDERIREEREQREKEKTLRKIIRDEVSNMKNDQRSS